jgi:signal transduction histidine kinase
MPPTCAVMTHVAIAIAAALVTGLGATLLAGRSCRAAVRRERAGMARDLHDGLAQELAFIVTQTRRVAAVDDRADETLAAVARAAQRALDESRTLIGDLRAGEDRPIDIAVVETTEELARRTGASVRVAAAPGVVLPAATRDALVRIVREGVTNAVRHAHASDITVELTGERGIHLRISDNGVGFDPATASRAGFGLTSMRDRARAAGGDLQCFSSPGAGTQIEVVFP